MDQVKKIEYFGGTFLLGCIFASLFLPHPGLALHCCISLAFFTVAAISIHLFCERRLHPLPLFVMIFLCGAISILRASSSGNCVIEERPDSSAFRLFSDAIDRLGFSDSRTTALIKALLLGDKSGLSAATAGHFRQSGAAHLLALSGLHLGLVYGVISLSLRLFGNSPPARIFRSATAVFFCLCYCIMVGAGPSVSRAMIFVVLREYGKLTCRCTDLRNLLWASLVLHLSISPGDLTSLGFQMSYLAVAGIAYIFPTLRQFYPEGGPKFSPVRKIWESAALSISCQATTLPLAYLRFGTAPSYFILTNLICLPLTGIIIPMSLVLTLGAACGVVWEPAVWLCEKFVEALLFSVEVISGI